MHADGQVFIDIFALLSAAVIAVPVFHHLGLGSVLGYLFAGIVLGPSALAIIDNVDDIYHFAEFGVIFLLFLIGIEMKPARLWVMRRWVFGLGMAQIFVTGGLLTLAGLYLDLPLRSALIAGMGLALSSTAFGLQILSEKAELTSVTGRTAFSVLLMQDLAVLPLLVMVSLLGGGAELFDSIGRATVNAILGVALVVIAGRYLLNPFLDRVAASQNSEVFIAAAVLLVLGAGKLMEIAGLSMALGAFLAGLMLAESHYRHQIEADIQPFRGILLGLFFMSVGMSLNVGVLLGNFALIAGLVVLLILIKIGVIWLLCRVSKLSNLVSLRVAFLLSQSGEFGFVLFGLALVSGVLIEPRVQILSLMIILSMILTPLLVKLGDKLSWYLEVNKHPDHPLLNIAENRQNHIILAGFGRVGKRIASIMENAQLSYIALDYNQQMVTEGRLNGFPVFFGDASKLKVLKAAGADRASMLIVALDNREHAENLVTVIRQNYPNLPIHARGRSRSHCETLLSHGANTAVSETLEASLRLAELALTDSGVDQVKTSQLLNDYRHGYYQRLREQMSSEPSETK
ncbi:monovalent cation:proton antiporter-2 (CPA2) family protein [Methylomarinum vadi]|uniref:monovalent cation:proton antiporter-2 (CPA2) family protein n=1 Tax=Methylomarinum vadi TaxID=438855 RepID=UPI0004DFB7C2|nr:monovalent cation:proton antiporter-2 (CPA2) family protein [Methylomarinum vadi]